MNEISATRKSTPDTSFLAKKHKKITISYLENAGTYYLQRFPASIHQFKQVMSRKIDKSCRDHPDQDRTSCLQMLNQVTEKFINLGYLNDSSFASALLYSLQLKNFSKARILRTMSQKGLPAEIITTVIPDINQEDDLKAAVRWCKRKKLGHYATREQPNQHQRHLASLARAGFSYECASKALTMSPDDADSFSE